MRSPFPPIPDSGPSAALRGRRGCGGRQVRAVCPGLRWTAAACRAPRASAAQLTILSIVFLSTSAAFATNVTAEQEVRSFLAEYERAIIARDIPFLERVLPEDYVFSGPSGKMTNRAQALGHFKQQRDEPGHTLNSLKHVNVKVHVVGNMAIVTNDWIAQPTPINSIDTEPTTDKGRHTGVLEKRNGQWMVIAEHDSEQIHDDNWMVSGILKASREYSDLTKLLHSGRSYGELEKSGDLSTLILLLADEYTYTTPDGEILNSAEDVERYRTNQIKIQTAELLEQKVRTIDNSSAIETKKTRYIGTDAGKPFNITKRNTVTWAFYAGRWQITADHASVAKQ